MIDRDAAARLGIDAQTLDDTLYDAFGQRQISTIFTQLNQYRVVLEVKPDFQKTPRPTSINIYVQSSTGGSVPLSTFTHLERANAPLTINHQGQFPVVNVSFNLGARRLPRPGSASGRKDPAKSWPAGEHPEPAFKARRKPFASPWPTNRF